MDLDYRRRILVHILEYLVNEKEQRELWIDKSRQFEPKDDFFHTIDEIVHFILDDMQLDTRANDAINVFLRNKEEADAVSIVAKALDRCVEELGDSSDVIYLQHSSWKQVISSADNAIVILKSAN